MENLTSNSSNWTNKWSVFCSSETDQVCADTPLYQCNTCKQYSFWIFFVFLLLLSVWILVGNLLVIIYVYLKNQTGWGYVRGSLAAADMITGFLLLSISLPSVVWTLKSTSREIYLEVQRNKNTVAATVGATAFMFCLSSFMYMLTFMSYYRYSAIRWPLKAQIESKKRTLVKLSVVWFLAIVTATYTNWFPGSYESKYYYYTFLYLPRIPINNTAQFVIACGTLVPYLILYILTSSLTVATGVIIRKKMIKSRKDFAGNEMHRSKSEKSSYTILALLVLTFSIAAVPALIAYSFAHAGMGNSMATLISNYLIMSNGAVNLLIYWKQDRKFKNFLKSLFRNIQKKTITSLETLSHLCNTGRLLQQSTNNGMVQSGTTSTS